MSVTDGQLVNAAITNAAFVSKTAASGNDVTGIIALKNAGQEQVLNLQQQVNLNKTKYYSLNQNINNRLEITAGIGRHIIAATSTSGGINLNAKPFLIGADVDTFTTPFEVVLYGTSDTDFLTLTYADAVGGCLLNGNFSLLKGNSITLIFDVNLNRFIEVGRNV